MHLPLLPCVTRVCIFLFFIISLSCGTIGSRIPAEYELDLIFIPIWLLSFWVDFNFGLSMWNLHVLSIPVWGVFQALCSNWSWWTCVFCAKLVDRLYANCQKGLICLWSTCDLSNALQKCSALSKHYANMRFLKHVALALVKANKDDRRQTSVTNRYAL